MARVAGKRRSSVLIRAAFRFGNGACPWGSAARAQSIQQGGVGKWGQVPMPPMTGLNPAEADALAAFVLKQ